jgi:hypothetical protein
LPIEGEDEEVPYTTPLIPSDVTFRDLTRTPKSDEPKRPKIAEARALIDERLADGEWHLSMIDELIEAGFSKSTAYRAAEPCVKVKASDGAWWWAAHGTAKSSFVELDGESGNIAARARSKPGGGRIDPQLSLNGSLEGSSHSPADSDESESAEGKFPPPTALPARAREGATPESDVSAEDVARAERIASEVGR